MDNEILNIYSDEYEIIGTSDYLTIHKRGFWHSSIHGWLIDKINNYILYQRRSSLKMLFPGKIDVSVGGHSRFDESPSETLFREGLEELGLNLEFEDVIKVGFRKSIDKNELFINKEFQTIFFINLNIIQKVFSLQQDEVDYLVLLRPKDVIDCQVYNKDIMGLAIIDNQFIDILVHSSDFIPSIDNYNLKIPRLIKHYFENNNIELRYE
jgi:isopentenyldiphosphate isomerase